MSAPESRSRYDPLIPWVYMMRQERERAIIRLIKAARLAPVSEKYVLEIECGAGLDLAILIKLGFSPERLTGTEAMAERAAQARRTLPSTVRIIDGDALSMKLPERQFDIVLQSTVFSSILDDEMQVRLANLIWSWIRPGGGILWYDFVFDNPTNSAVRRVPLTRVRSLFPEGKFRTWRITLAPPLSRIVTRAHPGLYHLFNIFPGLRTHMLCWIGKIKNGITI